MSHNIPQIITRSAQPLIGMTMVTTLNQVLQLKQMDAKFLARQAEILSSIGTERMLVELYTHGPLLTGDVPFTVIIGMPVAELNEIPPGMIGHTIPAGDYAKVVHTGPETDLPTTHDFYYGQWLPTTGRQAAPHDFEVWDARYQPSEPTNEIDLYFALQ